MSRPFHYGAVKRMGHPSFVVGWVACEPTRFGGWWDVGHLRLDSSPSVGYADCTLSRAEPRGILLSTTISLLNMKGGVGKTTLAVNLAWQLHSDGPTNVLLIDLDPQFNATQYVMDYKAFEQHRTKNGTICDFLLDSPKLKLKKGSKAKPSVAKAFHTVRETGGKKLQLLPADLDLARVVKNPSQSDFKLEKLLSQVREKFDYVIIDCAPTDSVLTTMALNASDHLLIPVKPDRFSILGLTNLLETIDAFRANCEDPHKVQVLGVVFTQVLNDQNLEAQAIAEVTSAAKGEGVYLFANRLRHTRSFMRSVKDQKPIFETLYARESRRYEVSDIADELKQELASANIKRTAKKATKVRK